MPLACCRGGPAPAEPDAIKPLTFYHELDSILAQLEGPTPAVRLLDSAWLLRRADALAAAASDAERAALALPHRQELERLHPEAFVSVDDVRQLERALGAERQVVGFAIGAISHAWAGADHPDPHGSSLLRVAQEVRAAQRGELRVQQPGAVAGPFGPTEYKVLPPRVALFFDWCSLFQAQKAADGAILLRRTPAEQAAFRQALSQMEVWFAHKMLFAVLLTSPPEGVGPGWVPYDERGWPTVERAWTMVAKTNVVACWPMILEVGTGADKEVRRAPPYHPERLAGVLEQRRFTSPRADRPLVTRLYRATLHSVLGGAEVLAFPRSGWADEDFVALADVLHLCVRCKRLELHLNACGDAGAQALASAARRGALPAVECLFLEQNEIGDAGCLALADALRADAMPLLRKLNMAGNRVSEAALDVLRDARPEGPSAEGADDGFRSLERRQHSSMVRVITAGRFDAERRL